MALLLAVAAVLIVVQASTESGDSGGEPAETTAAGQRPRTETTAPQRPRRPTYTVKLNDTLEGIAEKTGVSVERIQTLNSELDPQNLIVGQKIKLRE